MSFKVDDKIKHPKRPEWGLGTVVKLIPPDKLVVHFSHAGQKTLATRFIQLVGQEKNAKPPVMNSMEHQLQVQRLRPPVAPHLFDDEFTHSYTPAWKKMFIDEGLAEEWSDAFPSLFDEEDLRYAMSPQGRSSNNFLHWLSLILLHKHYGMSGLLRSYVFGFDRAKEMTLKKAMSIPEYLKFRELLPLKQKEGKMDAPGLFLFSRDYKTKFFVYVRTPDNKFSDAQIALMKALKSHGFGLKVLTVRPTAMPVKEYQ